ncbi:MAG: hypothetical protein MZU97_03320 [Bacillus subtilis]|nr:hypothetical protein [Bacillus subtilis]
MIPASPSPGSLSEFKHFYQIFRKFNPGKFIEDIIGAAYQFGLLPLRIFRLVDTEARSKIRPGTAEYFPILLEGELRRDHRSALLPRLHHHCPEAHTARSIRLRIGNRKDSRGVPGSNSLTISPFSHIDSNRARLDRGYTISIPVPRIPAVGRPHSMAVLWAMVSIPSANPLTIPTS